MIKIGTTKHIKKISGSPSLYKVQKIAHCGIDHLLKPVLSMWMKNIAQKRQQKTDIEKIYDLYIPSRKVLA